MGALGISVRNQVKALIDDSNLRSNLTLIPVTRTVGSDGGYSQPTETDGTSRTVFCIPSNYIKSRTGLEKFGDLREGEIRFLINYDEVLDADDKVTFESQTYHVRLIKPIFFNEETIAQSIILSREFD